MRGIPEPAIKTTLAALTDATIKQYNSTYKTWWKFCCTYSVDPFKASTSDVLIFFQHLIDSSENTFASFNTHRSALSLILPGNVGEDKNVKRFLKGIYRLRPPKPRYTVTWDPQIVLNFLKEFPINCLKNLSLKLVTLLALSTGHRLQTISLIKLSSIKKSANGVQINISDFIKTSGVGKPQPCFNFPFLVDLPDLCVSRTLLRYIDFTEELRPSGVDELFLTLNKPHQAATKQTLGRWIKETLRSAGVDTDIFKAHSTRHASTSAALRNGLSVDSICKAAGWTSKSTTFARFYNRPLVDSGQFTNQALGIL